LTERDLGRRRSRGDQPLHLGGDRLRLGTLGRAAPESNLAAGPALQVLLDAVRSRLDHGPSDVEDAPSGAVVALQAHDLRVRELALEVAQVLLGRAPEAVDPLVVVAHHRDVAVLLDEQPEHHALGEVRVLVLVDQDVPEAVGDALAHVGVLVEQPEGAHDERAEVEGAALGQEPVVIDVEPSELELPRRAGPGGIRVARLGGAALRVSEVVLGRDHLVAQAVDPRHEAGQKRGRIAVDVVVAEAQLVEAVEQQGQAVGGGDRREERVESRLERLLREEA
jgi:hypothetical protein